MIEKLFQVLFGFAPPDTVSHDPEQAILHQQAASLLVNTIAAQVNNAVGKHPPTIAVMDGILKSYLSQEEAMRKAIYSGELVDRLESMKGMSGLTPFNVFMFIFNEIEPVYRHIFYRNGYIAPDGYEATAEQFHYIPSTAAVEVIMNAVEKAEERNEALALKHFLLALLLESDIRHDLHEAGIENVTEFTNKVISTLDKKRGDGYRYAHAFRMEKSVDALLQKFTAASMGLPDQTLVAPLLFSQLLALKPIQTLLEKAGLTPEITTTYSEISQKRQNEPVDKDNDDATEFKVSDSALEEAIEKYARDLTAAALQGDLDEPVGRETEAENIFQIFMCRDKGNVALLGDAGVGKSAMFDKIACRIVAGAAPEYFMDSRVLLLDMAGMTAGAAYRGVFEERLKTIIDGVAERNRQSLRAGTGLPFILAIDELHAGMQAGSAQDTPAAGEQLKPALAAGAIRLMAATTFAEYTQYILKDPALERRFASLTIDEPSLERTVEILQGIKSLHEEHHKLTIADELIEANVKLVNRYVQGRYRPDVNRQVQDAACSRARLRGATALELSDVLREVAALAKLSLDFVTGNDSERIATLGSALKYDVLGQEDAMDEIANQLLLNTVGNKTDRSPLATFLLIGDTGVGKTQTARSLARHLFGTEDALVRIDMAEYMSSESYTRLVGAPVAYGGKGEGELITAIRKRPYSVIVFDEIEKAHPDILKSMLALLDESSVTDGLGRKLDFRHSIILMTSNVGAAEAQKSGHGFGFGETVEGTKQKVQGVYRKALEQRFPAEFIGRFHGVLIYNNLTNDNVITLLQRELEKKNQSTLQGQYHYQIKLSEEALQELASKANDLKYGVRQLKQIFRANVSVPAAVFAARALKADKSDNVLPASEGVIIEMPRLGECYYQPPSANDNVTGSLKAEFNASSSSNGNISPSAKVAKTKTARKTAHKP
ncbi:MAG: AAA family ATPase [Alphaproteobacteria bacterium]